MKTSSSQNQEPVAKLYAKALFELAQEDGKLEKVQSDLDSLVTYFKESPELRQALAAFMFSAEAREKIATEIAEKAGFSPLTTRFVQLLIAKNRVHLVEAIQQALRDLVDETRNTIRGTVTTVEPLSESERSGLSAAFGKKFNKQVILEPIIDKDLLGGLVVKVQGLTFDGSLKTTIRRLKENLERQSI